MHASIYLAASVYVLSICLIVLIVFHLHRARARKSGLVPRFTAPKLLGEHDLLLSLHKINGAKCYKHNTSEAHSARVEQRHRRRCKIASAKLVKQITRRTRQQKPISNLIEQTIRHFGSRARDWYIALRKFLVELAYCAAEHFCPFRA